MKRMSDRAKRLYTIIVRAVSAVVAVATVILCIIYFAVDSLKDAFIIKNFPIIVVGITAVILLVKILVEDVIFRKDFRTIPNKSDNGNHSDTAEQTNDEKADVSNANKE